VKRCHYCPSLAVHMHHIVRENKLPKELKRAEANLIPVCWTDHQRLHSGGPNALRETEADLPHGFHDFIREHQLFGRMPKHLQTDENWKRVAA
jgi:hypothetical protein